jgi:hypothetical protein
LVVDRAWMHISVHFPHRSRKSRFVCAEHRYITRDRYCFGPSLTRERSTEERSQIAMRILVAVAPIMYRQTLAHILRRDRPDDEVRLADPHSLDREASSFGPHLIVCNDDAPEIREEVSVPSWVVIRYHDSLSASVFLDGQDPRLVQDMSIEDLIGVVEETHRLVA